MMEDRYKPDPSTRRKRRTKPSKLTHPVVVHGGDSALETLTNLHVNVLIETRSHWAEGGQWGPIILTS